MNTQTPDTNKFNTLKTVKFALLLAASLCAAGMLLWLMKYPFFHTNFFQKDILNYYVNYELSTIFVSLGLIILFALLAKNVRLTYLNPTRWRGVMQPSVLLGMRKPDLWEKSGWSIGLIITLVTGIVLYFQTRTSGYAFQIWPNMLMIVPLALANSFTEEVVFRFSYISMVRDAQFSPAIGISLGAAVFGIVHYWGTAPSGLLGGLMAAWIGYFLSKSLLETKGFFWAWVIHFAQDVVIMAFLFNMAPS